MPTSSTAAMAKAATTVTSALALGVRRSINALNRAIT
jgi:hypothetical protein